jgi:putative tryptophan/tyrosine transport system substrate-binding protein
MDRRIFIAAVAGNLIAVSFAAIAQRSEKAHRIGVLSLTEGPLLPQDWDWEPLQALGWVEGKNLLIERRYTNRRADLLKSMAEQLVRLDVELIVASGTVPSQVAKSVTTSIPIIAYRVADPVGNGLVASLSRPGGNVTAISIIGPELDLKRLELLHELLPSAKAIGELWNSTNPASGVGIGEKEKGYRSLGIQPIFVEVAAANELDGAVAKVAQRGGKALIVSADPLFFYNNFSAIVRAAQSFQLPIVVATKDQLDAGALLSYGPRDAEMQRMLSVYVDKILKGAKPADLPVLLPTKFNLVINLKTAKALGLSIPQSLLLRADEVIQ